MQNVFTRVLFFHLSSDKRDLKGKIVSSNCKCPWYGKLPYALPVSTITHMTDLFTCWPGAPSPPDKA